MNTLVFTIAIGDYYSELQKLTEPYIKKYADKIGADYLCHKEVDSKFITQKWQKFKIFELLNKYDRILYIDIDILIRRDAPNLFDIVPKTEFGIFNEGKYSFRQDIIKQTQEYYQELVPEWTRDFYNSGVMVISKMHKSIFKLPKGIDYVETDQAYINLRLKKDKYKVHELSYKFNRMSILDEFYGESRLASYFIHYAGAPQDQIFNVMVRDMITLNNTKDYSKFNKKNIVFSISAGMGDQLCAEPVIRYAIKNQFKNDNLKVVSHHKRLFEHLEQENVEILNYEEYKGNPDATLVLRTTPDEGESGHNLSHVFFHPTDFAALSSIRMTLPNKEKTIKLKVKKKDYEEIFDIFPELKKGKDFKDMILVHAGKWWPSKTFPVEWWQEIVDNLVKEGYKVGLIGKTIDEKQGYQPVECPKGAYDFRDITSLGGLMALISLAEITLTNDSSPVHISGAFNNWLITIPTCKMGDHILPYRKGTQYYKTDTIYEKLILEDIKTNWLDEYPDTIDMLNGNIYDYIPKTKDVISLVKKRKK